MELLGLIEDENQHHQIDKLKEISVEMAILNAFSEIEKITYEIAHKIAPENAFLHSPMKSIEIFIGVLENEKLISKEQFDKFKELRSARNYIAHGRLDSQKISKNELENLFQLAKTILKSIHIANEKGLFNEENIGFLFKLW